MVESSLSQVETLLVVEIQRYLDVVETFRREGHEPQWRSSGGLADRALYQQPLERIIEARSGGRG